MAFQNIDAVEESALKAVIKTDEGGIVRKRRRFENSGGAYDVEILLDHISSRF